MMDERRSQRTGASIEFLAASFKNHSAISVAQQSYELNDQRIRESEGLPIELLQSIAALADAQTAYAEAAANYNRAQYELMGAMGNLVGN